MKRDLDNLEPEVESSSFNSENYENGSSAKSNRFKTPSHVSLEF